MIDSKTFAVGCYRENTAINVLAILLLKQNNQSIKKLCNLMYEAERFSMSYVNSLITNDAVYSTSSGFIPKLTYEHIKGDLIGEFSKWFYKPDENTLALKDGITEDKIINISDYDANVVDDVWDFYGHLNETDLIKWFMKNHQESGQPIEWRELLIDLGFKTEQFDEEVNMLYNLRELDVEYDAEKAERYSEMIEKDLTGL